MFNLKSGKQIASSDCFRFQDAWENQDDQHWGSYDSVKGEILESDYFYSKYLSYSDYSGTIENKANQKVLLEEFGDLDGVLQIYGGYSTSLILVRIDVLDNNEELQKTILGLEDWPILDEDNLWKIEEEAKEEAITNWVLSDFKRLVQKTWNYDFSLLNDNFLRELFYQCVEKTNEEWFFEYTDAVISIDRILKELEREDFLECFNLAKENFEKSIRKD